jgi:hypothetical protein
MPSTIKAPVRLIVITIPDREWVRHVRKDFHEARVSEEIVPVGRDPAISRALSDRAGQFCLEGFLQLMTMGWHKMLGFSPALFGCYIWEENHSYQMLRRSKECVIRSTTAVKASS